MRLCSEKILLLVTNYDLQGITVIIRKSVHGHFELLYLQKAIWNVVF